MVLKLHMTLYGLETNGIFEPLGLAKAERHAHHVPLRRKSLTYAKTATGQRTIETMIIGCVVQL